MASDLFDPLLELALDVARRGAKKKPPVAAPSRLTPLLKFTRVPGKAKDTVLDVLDTDDEFRARVLEKADEITVGRLGMSYLARPDGWETFVATMVEAAEEPVVEPSRSLHKLESQLEAATKARDTALDDLARAQRAAEAAETEREAIARERDELELEIRRLQGANADLVEQRRRAVAELKQTEAVMVRHVQERKRLESQVEAMAAAQLATTAVGGGVTDIEVRASADALDDAIDELRGHVDHLRRQATPERVRTARRTPLPVPPGVFDDSEEMTDYLFAIPNMLVLVDGYNVTKEAHGDWDLEQQRDWLEQGLRALASSTNATFDVVFDGAGIVTSGTRETSSGVRIRFSPEGVEADDVLIADVGTVDRTRPLTVVSSDKRVRSGARDGGANLLTSRQLLERVIPGP